MKTQLLVGKFYLSFVLFLAIAISGCQNTPTGLSSGSTNPLDGQNYSLQTSGAGLPGSILGSGTSAGGLTSAAGTTTQGNLVAAPSSAVVGAANSRFYPQYMYGWNPLPVSKWKPPVRAAALSFVAVDNVVFNPSEGAHFTGSPTPPSDAPDAVGGVTDCGSGPCLGNEFIWQRHTTYSDSTSNDAVVAVDFFFTAEGAHIPGGPAGGCASAKAVGSLADCGGGKCYGNQLACLTTVPIKSVQRGSVIVTDIQITPPGQHTPGGIACATGYTPRSSAADCGNAQCYGNQIVCVKYQQL